MILIRNNLRVCVTRVFPLTSPKRPLKLRVNGYLWCFRVGIQIIFNKPIYLKKKNKHDIPCQSENNESLCFFYVPIHKFQRSWLEFNIRVHWTQLSGCLEQPGCYVWSPLANISGQWSSDPVCKDWCRMTHTPQCDWPFCS